MPRLRCLSCKYLGHEIKMKKNNETHKLCRRICLARSAYGKLKQQNLSNTASNLGITFRERISNVFIKQRTIVANVVHMIA